MFFTVIAIIGIAGSAAFRTNNDTGVSIDGKRLIAASTFQFVEVERFAIGGKALKLKVRFLVGH